MFSGTKTQTIFIGHQAQLTKNRVVKGQRRGWMFVFKQQHNLGWNRCLGHLSMRKFLVESNDVDHNHPNDLMSDL